MPYVSFISDERFREIVRELLAIGDIAGVRANEEFERNVIDPFSMLLEMACFNMDFHDWVNSEKNRQIQKTLSNDIGMLHQKILGSVSGWTDLKVGGGVDLVNIDKKLIAEIKNKHNTVTGGKRVNNYQELYDLIMPKASTYKNFKAYFVEIIPSTSKGYEKPFTPSDKKSGFRCPTNPNIIQIDGKRFYKLVTGVDDALEQVFKALPKVITDCRQQVTMTGVEEAAKFFKSAFVPKPPSPARRKRRQASQ
jgi:hypothetical protein